MVVSRMGSGGFLSGLKYPSFFDFKGAVRPGKLHNLRGKERAGLNDFAGPVPLNGRISNSYLRHTFTNEIRGSEAPGI